jgi:acetyl esterase/lipase
MKAAFAALLIAVSGSALAQMPADIAARVKELGVVIDPPGTAAIYAPLQEKEPYAGVKVERDVKYGPDARHALDVFVPEAGSGPRPVLVFVHGGAFVGGNKRTGQSPFYDNIALAAVKSGMVGVNITYRLAPAHKWPAGVDDTTAAITWVQRNIASRGGDPARIFLMGHSAGAVHVASFVGTPVQYRGIKGPYPQIAGAILVSGLYDFTVLKPGPGETAYYGEKAGTEEVSTLKGLADTRVPLMVAYAELDPPFFVEQAKLLNHVLCGQGRCPAFVELKGHSHMSEVYAIGTADRGLLGPLLEFASGRK